MVTFFWALLTPPINFVVNVVMILGVGMLLPAILFVSLAAIVLVIGGAAALLGNC